MVRGKPRAPPAFRRRGRKAPAGAPRRSSSSSSSSGVLPFNGEEPEYAWLPYGSPVGRANNNCTAYAYGVYSSKGNDKLQPGGLGGEPSDFSLRHCAPIRKRVLADLPGSHVARPDQRCRVGSHKVMVFLDKHGKDYHFYRQHSDIFIRAREGDTLRSIARFFGVPTSKVGVPRRRPPPPRVRDVDAPLRRGVVVRLARTGLWSHKRGLATGPLLVDACQKPLRDPRRSCQRYGPFDYSKLCGTFCVPSMPRSVPRLA